MRAVPASVVHRGLTCARSSSGAAASRGRGSPWTARPADGGPGGVTFSSKTEARRCVKDYNEHPRPLHGRAARRDHARQGRVGRRAPVPDRPVLVRVGVSPSGFAPRAPPPWDPRSARRRRRAARRRPRRPRASADLQLSNGTNGEIARGGTRAVATSLTLTRAGGRLTKSAREYKQRKKTASRRHKLGAKARKRAKAREAKEAAVDGYSSHECARGASSSHTVLLQCVSCTFVHVLSFSDELRETPPQAIADTAAHIAAAITHVTFHVAFHAFHRGFRLARRRRSAVSPPPPTRARRALGVRCFPFVPVRARASACLLFVSAAVTAAAAAADARRERLDGPKRVGCTRASARRRGGRLAALPPARVATRRERTSRAGAARTRNRRRARTRRRSRAKTAEGRRAFRRRRRERRNVLRHGRDRLARASGVGRRFRAKSQRARRRWSLPRSAADGFFLSNAFSGCRQGRRRRRRRRATIDALRSARCFRRFRKPELAARLSGAPPRSVARRLERLRDHPMARFGGRPVERDGGFRGASSTRRRASGLERRETLSPASSRRPAREPTHLGGDSTGARERAVACLNGVAILVRRFAARSARAPTFAAAARDTPSSISSSSVSLTRDREAPAARRVAASSLCVRKNADPWNRSSAPAGGDSALRGARLLQKFLRLESRARALRAGAGTAGLWGRLDVSYPRVTFSFSFIFGGRRSPPRRTKRATTRDPRPSRRRSKAVRKRQSPTTAALDIADARLARVREARLTASAAVSRASRRARAPCPRCGDPGRP